MDATTFKDEEVIKYSKQFVNVKLNLSQPDSVAREFAAKHQIRGVPTVIFLDATGGELLSEFSGYRDAEGYLKEMKGVTDFIETRRAYEKTPGDILLNLKLAIAYMERNRIKDAQPMIERVLKADPDNQLGYAIQIYTQRASLHITQGEFEQAKPHIEKVRQFDNDTKFIPGLYFQMGYELGNRNQMDEAVSYFEKVMATYPESAAADDSRFFAGFVYFIQQKDDRALPLLQEYVKTGKNEILQKHAQDRIKEIEKRQK